MSSFVPFPRLRPGLVAILRGLRPEEAAPIGRAVFDAGIDAIEVPLNSPDPFRSIARLVEELPGDTLIGAGTVLTTAQVDELHGVGGRLLVSPNIDRAVLQRAAGYGMVTMPGVFTPTEAFEALKCGASALKFFPASVLGAKGIAAIRAVLPRDAVIGAVGGVSDRDFADYRKVGVTVFGLGSSLYQAGFGVEEVRRRAVAAVAAWDEAFAEERP